MLHTVAAFPRAGGELALDIQLRAFAHIALTHGGDASPSDDIVPLGTLRHLRAVVLGIGAVGGGQRELGDLDALHVSYFGVLAGIAEQDDFVNAHDCFYFFVRNMELQN